MEQWNSVKNPPETKVSHKESYEKSLDSNTKGLDSLAREGLGSKHLENEQFHMARLKCLEGHFSLARENMRGKELRRDCENKST